MQYVFNRDRGMMFGVVELCRDRWGIIDELEQLEDVQGSVSSIQCRQWLDGVAGTESPNRASSDCERPMVVIVRT